MAPKRKAASEMSEESNPFDDPIITNANEANPAAKAAKKAPDSTPSKRIPHPNTVLAGADWDSEEDLPLLQELMPRAVQNRRLPSIDAVANTTEAAPQGLELSPIQEAGPPIDPAMSALETLARAAAPSPELGGNDSDAEGDSVVAEATANTPHSTVSTTTSHLNLDDAEIVGFKVDAASASVTLGVEFPGGTTRFIPEFTVQDVDEEMVLRFWKDQGGRGVATGLETYWVFKILKRRKVKSAAKKTATPKYEYLVQWVGYGTGPKDATWESEEWVMDCAEAHVAKFKQEKGLK